MPVRERPALAVALRGAASPVSTNTAGSAPSSGSAATLATTGRRPRVAVFAGRRPRCGGGAFGGAAARALLARVAVLVELDELVFADRDGRSLRAAFDDRIGDAGGVQRDGAHGVIVAGNHVVDAVRRAVGVHHRDDRDAELLGFEDRDLFVADVDDEDDVRAATPSS